MTNILNYNTKISLYFDKNNDMHYLFTIYTLSVANYENEYHFRIILYVFIFTYLNHANISNISPFTVSIL